MDRWFASVATLVLVAGACAASETVTLYYWGTEWDTLSSDLIQGFEALHDGSDGRPAIKVVMGQTASINRVDDPQRLVTAVAGGDPPDVVWFNRFAVGGLAARGAFQSLQRFYERDLAARPDDPMTLKQEMFFEPSWADAIYEGELYAVPADTDNRALYYNQDILDRYADQLIPIGCVDPADPAKAGPPRTWEQLRQCAELLTEYDADGRLRQVGFIPNFGNSWLYLYGWLNGGEFMSEDGRTCTLNDPRIVEALAYMTELYDAMGGAEAVSAFQSTFQSGDLDPFLSGTVAMRIDTDGFLNTIANRKRDMRFGVAMAPAPEGRASLGWSAGWSWVVPTGAKHPEEAWEFMKYLASKRAYQIRADAMRQAARASGSTFIPWFSTRRDITVWALEHYLYSDVTVEQKFKDAKRLFVEALPSARCLPVTPVGQLLWTSHVRAMEDGIYKRYDPSDPIRNAQIALDTNTAVVQKELDRIYKHEERVTLRWAPIVVAYIGLMLAACVAVHFYFVRKTSVGSYFRRELWAGYCFASPWMLGFLVFGGGPLLFSLLISFCEYDVLGPPQFVGLKNYHAMFTDDPLFYKSLWNTVYMAFGIPLSMAVGLGLAMLLSYEVKGMAVYRTFFYLPAIMPAVAASILWIWIFNPHQGVLNDLLARVGIEGPAWLQNRYWSKPALILMGLWGAGSGMIVWLAGIKGIPKHLYEAAKLDGAGPVRSFLNITVPMLSPYILFNFIIGLIGAFQIFTQAFIMTQGGPVDSTLFYAYHLFNNAFRYLKMGYASALAWVLFAIVLVLTILQLRASKLWVHYESDS
ncbi:MAG: extracellular solute-binding protein [Nitrospiraceae bacterium]|nr:extracellular solute-binding protein [Nitrospiraceae bacterium]